MLEAIGTYKNGISYEVSRNIVVDLRKRGTFGSFSDESMQLVLKVMRHKVEYALKRSRKMAGQL